MFLGSSADVLLICLIVAEVTPQVSISQMSRAIEVELKQIGDQLKRLRRREKELLQDQERYFAAAIARNRGSYYNDGSVAVGFLAQNREWQQQLREEQEQLRQLQGSWELQQRPHIFFPYMEKLLQYYQRNQEEQQQQQEQQQRGTKRKLCSESSSSSTSSSSDDGSESHGYFTALSHEREEEE